MNRLSVNELAREIMLMDCRWGNDRCEAVLGVHEAVTLLWRAVKHEDRGQMEKRLANVLIGGLVAARRMGIADIEDILQRRMEELRLECG